MLRIRIVLAVLVAVTPAGAAVSVSRYLEVDQMVGGVADARPAFAAVAAKVGTCPEIGREAGPHVRCLLAALDEFRQDGDGKLSTLLLERRADPYSVTAALLLLHGDPARLHAVVLGAHVLIGLSGNDDWYFDPLNGGREMTAGYAFSTYGLPFSRAEQADVDLFLGHYAARLGAASPSEKLYRLAVKAAPGSARVRYAFGAWLLRQNRLDEARDQLAKSTELGPDDFDAWMDRGTALEKAGRFKAARRSYAQALRVDPRSKAAAEKVRAMDVKIDAEAAKDEP
ncbi:MAG TPA: tetratricopeptide repeat protein [Candidatus Polarisedimenticolaceae bacterium]|nr:tetratricopeptide repeat protein [Candidatus Polarisedimenticolaceae bacterium]